MQKLPINRKLNLYFDIRKNVLYCFDNFMKSRENEFTDWSKYLMYDRKNYALPV